MSAGSSAGLLSLACVVQNESSVNINSLLTRYSFAEAADELKLRGEIALWRQRWIRLKTEFNDVVPATAVAALAACDQMAFPLIHTFLSILFTLSVISVVVFQLQFFSFQLRVSAKFRLKPFSFSYSYFSFISVSVL